MKIILTGQKLARVQSVEVDKKEVLEVLPAVIFFFKRCDLAAIDVDITAHGDIPANASPDVFKRFARSAH
jgi:hypothetical protein